MNAALHHRLVFLLALVASLGLAAPVTASDGAVTEQTPWGGVSQGDALSIAHELIDRVFNDHDAAAAAALVDDDAVIQTPVGTFTGPEGLLDYLDLIVRGYPDATFDLSSVVSTGGSVTITLTMHASRYQIEPNEPAVDVQTTVPTTLSIGVENHQVAGVSVESGDIATTSVPPVAYSPLPGQPH